MKTKRKGLFSKLIVLFVILANTAFTTAVLYVFLRTASEPSTLIGAWFAFTTAEILSLAKIKNNKVKNGGNNNDT